MMLGARIGAWGGKHLPYLRRVAYLESHGTEYVSTGISFSDTKVFSCRYSFNRIDISAQVVLGCLGANTNLEFCCRIDNSQQWDNAHSSGHGSVLYSPSESTVTGKWYNFTGTNNNKKSIFEGTMDVFRRNRAGTIGGFCYAYVKISELKVEKDGVDLLSMIPVLDFSVRPCFYNQAPSVVPATDPSRYFYNQGTGEFGWGEL